MKAGKHIECQRQIKEELGDNVCTSSVRPTQRVGKKRLSHIQTHVALEGEHFVIIYAAFPAAPIFIYMLHQVSM